MATPPAKKVKVNSVGSRGKSTAARKEARRTISMIVGHEDCLSPVYRVDGYPWRLRVCMKDDGTCELFIRCEKSMEAELWECDTVINLKDPQLSVEHKFCSMDKKSQEQKLGFYWNFPPGTRLDVGVMPYPNGNEWKRRPTLDLFDRRDVCLVIEDKEIPVNKQSLASQSSFFDRLFNSDFREKNMAEIPIEDVGYEEFTNLIRMVYGKNDVSIVADFITCENVNRILELADRFDLKIVEDGVVNWLLSSDSSLSIHEKLVIADQHRLTMCKTRILKVYKDSDLMDLCGCCEYAQLSVETKDILFKKCCNSLFETQRRLDYFVKDQRR